MGDSAKDVLTLDTYRSLIRPWLDLMHSHTDTSTLDDRSWDLARSYAFTNWRSLLVLDLLLASSSLVDDVWVDTVGFSSRILGKARKSGPVTHPNESSEDITS